MRLVVMGVTGCGKSSIGAGIADVYGGPFADGDDFHPAANVAKMASGTPLTDEDRWPWLDAVGAWLRDNPDGVMACSALKRAYRDRLRSVAGALVFVHVTVARAVLEERVAKRSATTDHFAGVALLDSQFAALEPLGFDEPGGSIDATHSSVAQIVEIACEILELQED